MTHYLNREGAREFLSADLGVFVGGDGLKDHATRGTGPRYAIINGRALYSREDLALWVQEQASRPPRKRKVHAT